MLAAFYFLPISRLELDLYDEAIRLYAAEQIVAGQKPYQDFYAIYGPGEFLPIALGFVCFGKEILIARLIMVANNAVAAMALFALLRHFQLSRAVCLSGLILWLIPRHASGLVLYACSPALTLLLLAALVFARSKTLTLGKIAWIAGGLIGLATICRHDFGCYGFIAGLVAIIGYPAGAEYP